MVAVRESFDIIQEHSFVLRTLHLRGLETVGILTHEGIYTMYIDYQYVDIF